MEVNEWERRRALYLNELTFEAGYWREVAIHAGEGVIEFSKEFINAIYLLNGGGIVVIATAAQMLQMKTPTAVELAIPFFAGLVAALICNLAAYFVQAFAQSAYDDHYWRAYNGINRLYFPEHQNEKLDKRLENLGTKATTARTVSRRCRYVALGFGVAGLLAFAIGGLRFIWATT